MSQRTIALLAAMPLLAIMLGLAAFVPLPFATYKPCQSVDVLAETDQGAETIQIEGKRTYRDDGELRLTTVCVSPPKTQIGGLELLTTWLDRDAAVLPYDVVHPNQETRTESQRKGAAQMVASQDISIAAALQALDFKVTAGIQVVGVEPDSPADGVLEVRDVFKTVNSTPINTPEELIEQISEAEEGESVEMQVFRGSKTKTVQITPEEKDGRPQIGVSLGAGFDFPFDVTININPAIGGPSAGLIFSLGIYDTLTPGPIAGGALVAGTGTIDNEGTVGPIGGIQQKVAGAREQGAELFLVPPANCDAALGAENGDMRLVSPTTLDDAIAALETYAKDPEADLPTCEDVLEEAGR